SSTYSVSAALYPTLPYDPGKDLVALAPFGSQPYLLVVAPTAAFKSVAELIRAAKTQPGRMDYGSAGVGSSTHLVAEKFRATAGMEAVHIPYKNLIDANTDT